MIEWLEPRRLMAAAEVEAGIPEDLLDRSVTLRKGTLYVLGDPAFANVISVHLSRDRRNVNVATRFGHDATGAADDPPAEWQFATALVRRVVVRGGEGADRVAVGSLPEVVAANGTRVTYSLTDPSAGDEQVPNADATALTDPAPFDAAVAFSDARQLRPRRGTVLLGGDGNDVLIGGRARDRMAGDAGEDTLVGLGDADHLDGGMEDDTLEGGPGGDQLRGGPENDRINLSRGSQRQDRIFGGPGDDVIDFAAGLKPRDRDGNDIIQDRIR
jgi:Ca2+-binding RTX toxin-like protein